MIHIILPCAGRGSRLGLTSPKELFEIFPNKHLIDYSLDWIKNHPLVSTVSVVIRNGKESVFEYVRNSLPKMNVRSVLFDSNYEEWPGSVQSAVIDKNDHYLALLPDSVIRMPQNLDLVKTVDSLIQNHPVVFGCLSEIKDHDITKLGAVRIDLNKKIITAFQDKPQENIDLYNAFWGCYGFQGKASQELYQFLISSVNKGNNDYEALSSHPFKSFPIQSYTDLGTWENIESFRNTISQNI